MDSAIQAQKFKALVVMGVSGCGKSSAGQAFAEALGWALHEGDTYHAPESIAKMRAGTALTDADRSGWLDRLAGTFYKRAEVFAKGKKLRREGRAPYLQILRWLSLSDEWTIDLDREMSKHPALRGSVSQVVEKGHLQNLLEEQAGLLGDLLHYDSDARVLAVEDPKFFYFIKNLPWNRFAERIGYFDVSFSSRYDFALSFAGSDRDIAEMLFESLSDLEHGIFYDRNEQSRILAENVE